MLFASCSKDNGASSGSQKDARIYITVKDVNETNYSSGYVRLQIEAKEKTESGSFEVVNRHLLKSINDVSGKATFIFRTGDYDLSQSIKIEEIAVLNNIFEAIETKDEEVMLNSGDFLEDELQVQVENGTVFWERLDFNLKFNLKNKKILAIVGNDFDYQECYTICKLWEYNGAAITYASYQKDLTAHILKRVGFQYQRDYVDVSVDILLDNVNPEEYDLLFFPGGSGPANLLQYYPGIKNMVKNAYDNGILIAGICHGPLVIAESGIIEGKTATGFPDTQTTIERNGGTYVNETVVVDGSVITGNWPNFNTFAKTVAEVLETQ